MSMFISRGFPDSNPSFRLWDCATTVQLLRSIKINLFDFSFHLYSLPLGATKVRDLLIKPLRTRKLLIAVHLLPSTDTRSGLKELHCICDTGGWGKPPLE